MRCNGAKSSAQREELDSLRSWLESKIDTQFASIDTKLNGLSVEMQRGQAQLGMQIGDLQRQIQGVEASQQQLKILAKPGSARPGSARPVVAENGFATQPSAAKPPWNPVVQNEPTGEATPLLRTDDHGCKPEEMTFQQKLAMAQSGMAAGKAQQSWRVKLVTQFLEDPESSKIATTYNWFMTLFNILAIGIGLLPLADITIPSPYNSRVDVSIDSVLLTEIVIRFTFCPNMSMFFSNWSNIVDFMSGLPLILQLLILDEKSAHTRDGVLLAAVPVIRLMRFVRRFPHMQILITSFKNCLEALPVLLYTMALLACLFTSLIYLAEPRNNITCMSDSAWLVLSTMTTVGYGDIVPETPLGHLLTAFVMIVSPLYMAMPFGIIGYSFTVIWGNRQQILLLQGTRDRLAKWGFGPYEIPRLFQLFDLDDSAEIDLQEFQILLKEMEIGFKEDDVVDLFKAIDKDSGGTIDEREFVKTLYPTEYRFMYGRKRIGEA